MLNKIIYYFLNNRVITILILLVIVFWGITTSPFSWNSNIFPENKIPVDAIPDIGDNQQIIATEWMGRSPKDIQDQITYPLSATLLGIPGVKTIRSSSMFGMSFIYLIFEDDIEFYWSRSRILEKLNSLPPGTLPEGVQPTLGPDATALGQIFWYTLEGRNPDTGEPNGGWDQEELRTIQDYYVKYGLAAANGVAEVASVGGFVKEYQIELNPGAMLANSVSIMDVMYAVEQSNIDIGAETMEINKVEYIIRGLGYIKKISDIENTVVTVREGIPIRISDIAFVNVGPATRRGGLDKEGFEATGGVVVARYGSNPLEVINNVKEKIEELNQGMPQKILEDGTISKVKVIPFYDRTSLIKETIGTLETALIHEILICIVVIIVLVLNLRASIVISCILPIAVLATFILMRYLGIAANIVALSGIAIAIGIMVDVGIVLVENIIRFMDMPENKSIRKGKELLNLIYKAVAEVSGAITTAILTTVVSFLPVFSMQAQEGKLFSPLAYTKTFALISVFMLGIIILPTISYYVFSFRIESKQVRKVGNYLLILLGIVISIMYDSFFALGLTALGINNIVGLFYEPWKKFNNGINIVVILFISVYYLSFVWLPMGPDKGIVSNFLFVSFLVAIILFVLWLLVYFYESLLKWCLDNRMKFMMIPIITLLFGILAWIGFERCFGFVGEGLEKIGFKNVKETSFWQGAEEIFPGIGEEFMPTLNEGSFLLMPTTMPHTGVEKNIEYIATLDRRVTAIPEIETSIGKWGRVNSALDPAPSQMFENIINYKSEYSLDENGKRRRFKSDKDGAFILIDGTKYNPANGFRVVDIDSLIAHKEGDYLRQWRPHIKNSNDIWNEIIDVTVLPGLTSAPKLQPIEARLVMLATGLRAPMGLKIFGPDLLTIDRTGQILENALKQVPSVLPSSVFYDRAVGAPYIEIILNRENMARYGVRINELQEMISAVIGGMEITKTVEGRERFSVRMRYPRDMRNNSEELKKILIPTATGTQIPLEMLASIEFSKDAQMIQSENTFLLGYVIFDKQEGAAEVDVVNEAGRILKEKIDAGEIILDKGVSYQFTGNFEQQERATRRLLIIIPLSLLTVFFILYFQFKTVIASLIHFSGVFVAFAGGFILLWLYGQDWFMNFNIGGENMRDLFQIHTINLSVAVWVGFIALFGIATDDGVLMGTYIHKVFLERDPQTKLEIREAVIDAGKKRVRPAAMTTATTLIALLPVLTSMGKGSDIMIPMAIPTMGGLFIQSMTMFVVPVLQCMWRENAILRNQKRK